MFKPEYILDNVATFGLADTMAIVSSKFQRLGKSKSMADKMAYLLVLNTVFEPE